MESDGAKQEYHFEKERRAFAVSYRLRHEQRNARKDHQGHSEERPGREGPGKLPNGLAPHSETRQSQIDNHQRSDQHAERHDMKCLIDGKHPLRMLEPASWPAAFAESKKPVGYKSSEGHFIFLSRFVSSERWDRPDFSQK